jgi:hypothetical protein
MPVLHGFCPMLPPVERARLWLGAKACRNYCAATTIQCDAPGPVIGARAGAVARPSRDSVSGFLRVGPLGVYW